jgi:hypothetical protein
MPSVASKTQIPQQSLPVRAAFPAKFEKSVLTLDSSAHRRDVPDRSYGRVVDASQNKDGTWTVKVGTFATSLAGPVPGKKPTNVVSYTVSADGKRIAPLKGSAGTVVQRAVLPAKFEKTVLKADASQLRDVPDRSYGRIIESKQNADGSWAVKVGTFETSLAGPVANKKPTNVKTYTVGADGKLIK